MEALPLHELIKQYTGQMLLLKESEDGWLRIYTADQTLVAEHRLVRGHFQRSVLEGHLVGLPQPRLARTQPLARQVIHPELSPLVQTRPLSVYAQLLEVDHD